MRRDLFAAVLAGSKFDPKKARLSALGREILATWSPSAAARGL
jgi:hypothetical protein